MWYKVLQTRFTVLYNRLNFYKNRRFHNINLNPFFHCGKLVSIMALTLFCGLYIPGLLSHNYTIISKTYVIA